MVVRAKKATILKIINNKEIPVVVEVKAAAKKSGRTSTKNKDKQDEEVGIFPTVTETSLLPDCEKSLVSGSKVSVTVITQVGAVTPSIQSIVAGGASSSRRTTSDVHTAVALSTEMHCTR